MSSNSENHQPIFTSMTREFTPTISSLDDCIEKIKGFAAGKEIVFTNGCFDVLHPGHIRVLSYCRNALPNSYVVVGLNSDDSVKRLKGPSRPFFSSIDRLTMLDALRDVDAVVIFEEDTPQRLIEMLQPSLIVKGGDYKTETVVGHEVAPVAIVPLFGSHSTSRILDGKK